MEKGWLTDAGRRRAIGNRSSLGLDEAHWVVEGVQPAWSTARARARRDTGRRSPQQVGSARWCMAHLSRPVTLWEVGRRRYAHRGEPSVRSTTARSRSVPWRRSFVLPTARRRARKRSRSSRHSREGSSRARRPSLGLARSCWPPRAKRGQLRSSTSPRRLPTAQKRSARAQSMSLRERGYATPGPSPVG